MLRLLTLIVVLFVLSAASAQARDRVDGLTTKQLRSEARKVATKLFGSRQCGPYYCERYTCSGYLSRLSYELVDRAFSPAYRSWAHYVVRRESHHCPGSVNSTERVGGWSGVIGLAQVDPYYHRWVNYRRMMVDPSYAVAVFVRLSRGGRNVQPWCLC